MSEWDDAPVDISPAQPMIEQRLGYDLQLCALGDADRKAVHIIAFDMDANEVGRIATVRESGLAAELWPGFVDTARTLYPQHLVAWCVCGHQVARHRDEYGCFDCSPCVKSPAEALASR